MAIGTQAARDLLEETLGESFEKFSREMGEQGVQELVERMARGTSRDAVQDTLLKLLSTGARENLSTLTAEAFERTFRDMTGEAIEEVLGTTGRRGAQDVVTETVSETTETASRRSFTQTLSDMGQTTARGFKFAGDATKFTFKATAIAAIGIPAAGLIYNHGHHAVEAWNFINGLAWGSDGEKALSETEKEAQAAIFNADLGLAGLKFKESKDGEFFYTYTARDGKVSTYVIDDESPTKLSQIMEDGERVQVTPEMFVSMQNRFKEEFPAEYGTALQHKNDVLEAIDATVQRERGFVGNMLADWGMDNPMLMKLADVIDHGGLGMAAGLAIAGIAGPSVLGMMFPAMGPLTGIIGGLGTPLLLGAAALTAVMSFVNPEPNEGVSPLDRIQSPLGLGRDGQEREVPGQERTTETEGPGAGTRTRTREGEGPSTGNDDDRVGVQMEERELTALEQKERRLEETTGLDWTYVPDGRYWITDEQIQTKSDPQAWFSDELDELFGLGSGSNGFTINSGESHSNYGKMYIYDSVLDNNLLDLMTTKKDEMAEIMQGNSEVTSARSEYTARASAQDKLERLQAITGVEWELHYSDGSYSIRTTEGVLPEGEPTSWVNKLDGFAGLRGDDQMGDGTFKVYNEEGSTLYGRAVISADGLTDAKLNELAINRDEVRETLVGAYGIQNPVEAIVRLEQYLPEGIELEAVKSGGSQTDNVIIKNTGPMTREEALELAEQLNGYLGIDGQGGNGTGGFSVVNVYGQDLDEYYISTTPDRVGEMTRALSTMPEPKKVLFKDAVTPDEPTSGPDVDEGVTPPRSTPTIETSVEETVQPGG